MNTDDQLKHSILIVDDEPVNIKVLIDVLQGDYQIKAANNGLQALNIARSKPRPDLILLDIMMPDMDGYSVLKELKKSRATSYIPVIFVTALSEELNEQKGLELGAVDYITKPVKPAIVLSRVKTHLTLYSAKKELAIKVAEKTRELNDAYQEMKNTFLETVKSFSFLLENKDESLAGHSRRVALSARRMANDLGLSGHEVDDVFMAGLLSRIGTITLSDTFLNKPFFNLSRYDREIMIEKIVNARLLFIHINTLKNAGHMIEHQFEHYDGSGLPGGLKGDKIPIGARILAIARDFDLLMEGKYFEKIYSVREALAHLERKKNAYYDPQIVQSAKKLYSHIKDPNKRPIIEVSLGEVTEGMELVEVKIGKQLFVRNMEATQDMIDTLYDIQKTTSHSCSIKVRMRN